MGSSERLCLRWNDFESNIKHGFSELREEEDFFDVTLACGSKQIKAHKVILSACSPFFRSIIKSVPHQHPLLYLRGIKFSHLESLLCFMYNGEVNVTQEELNNFLAVAEELKIKGLTQSHSGSGSPLPHETGGGPPPSKRPRLLGKSSSPTPRINNSTGALGGSSGSLSSSGPQGATSSAGNGSRGRHAGQLSNHPSGSSSSSRGGGNILQEEDDDIQDITASVVKSEPKEPPSGNTMVVTPDVSLAHEELGEDPYAQEEDNYEDYAQYGSDSGEINYAEGGAIMDPGLAAVPGPSGATAAADGNKDYEMPETQELVYEIEEFINQRSIHGGRDYGMPETVELVNEIEEFINQRSIYGGRGKYFVCLVCRIRPRDVYDNRKHLITHITENHDLFIGEKPGLLNRIDTYVNNRIFEASDGNFVCIICEQALGTKFIPLRRHFLLNHLKRRPRKYKNSGHLL